jgi:hypothetical protein
MTRTYFAQVIVPQCDDKGADGAVDIEVGAIEAGPGETALAWSIAEEMVEPLGCRVSCVWFDGAIEF